VDPAPDDRQDGSPQHRIAVECIFILTLREKLAFMRAVDKIGPLRATQLMYKALVTDEGQEQADAAGV